MRNVQGGKLLGRVKYCMKPVSKTTDLFNEPIEIRNTFPYNPESKTAGETALRWVHAYWDQREVVPEIIERDNEPFSITIIDLHHRSEGGRAYKVIDSEMRCFDLREDQVMETMRDAGIEPKGKAGGQFVWGTLGSQVRLVLVGGELHTSMLEGTNAEKAFNHDRKAGLHPTEATLVPGHIYRKKDKSTHVFLGRLKRVGISKTFFAFMPVPERGEKIEPNIQNYDPNNPYHRRLLEDQSVWKNWEVYSWRQRCMSDWQKYDRKTIYYSNINLLSSPKFEADVGEIERDFLEELRSNPDRRHVYVDGNQVEIIASTFKKENPDFHGYMYHDRWHCTSHYDSTDPAIATLAWKKTTEDFYAGLKWV